MGLRRCRWAVAALAPVTVSLGLWWSAGAQEEGQLPWGVGPALDSCQPASPACAGRYGHTATLLADGRVLVAGGTAGGRYLSTAEIYDPANRSWTATGAMHRARSDHNAVLLHGGMVLVVGGTEEGNVSYGHETAELYDPAATDPSTGRRGAWKLTPPPPSGNGGGSSATLLRDGRVLVAGGGGRAIGTASADLYDPPTNSWAPTGPLIHLRFEHGAALLQDGRVLVAGGWSLNFGPKLSSAEIYDPQTGTWAPTGDLPYTPARAQAVTLGNGQVLLTGGSAGTTNGGGSNTSVLYDPAAGTWTATGPMTTPRDHHTATVIAVGAVLVAGGDVKHSPTAEIYNPVTRTWALTSSMGSERSDHTATLLTGPGPACGRDCGRVIVVGGRVAQGALATTELFGQAQVATAAGRPGSPSSPGSGLRWWPLAMVSAAASAVAVALLVALRLRAGRARSR